MDSTNDNNKRPLVEQNGHSDSKKQKTEQKILPFLWFNDNLEAAISFWSTVFPNTKMLKDFRGKDGKLQSASFLIDGREYLGLNGGPYYILNSAFSLLVSCETQEEIDQYWEKLLDGGKPMKCGWIEDKFGVTWQIVPTALRSLLDGENGMKVSSEMIKMVKMDLAKLIEASKNNAITRGRKLLNLLSTPKKLKPIAQTPPTHPPVQQQQTSQTQTSQTQTQQQPKQAQPRNQTQQQPNQSIPNGKFRSNNNNNNFGNHNYSNNNNNTSSFNISSRSDRNHASKQQSQTQQTQTQTQTKTHISTEQNNNNNENGHFSKNTYNNVWNFANNNSNLKNIIHIDEAQPSLVNQQEMSPPHQFQQQSQPQQPQQQQQFFGNGQNNQNQFGSNNNSNNNFNSQIPIYSNQQHPQQQQQNSFSNNNETQNNAYFQQQTQQPQQPQQQTSHNQQQQQSQQPQQFQYNMTQDLFAQQPPAFIDIGNGKYPKRFQNSNSLNSNNNHLNSHQQSNLMNNGNDMNNFQQQTHQQYSSPNNNNNEFMRNGFKAQHQQQQNMQQQGDFVKVKRFSLDDPFADNTDVAFSGMDETLKSGRALTSFLYVVFRNELQEAYPDKWSALEKLCDRHLLFLLESQFGLSDHDSTLLMLHTFGGSGGRRLIHIIENWDDHKELKWHRFEGMSSSIGFTPLADYAINSMNLFLSKTSPIRIEKQGGRKNKQTPQTPQNLQDEFLQQETHSPNESLEELFYVQENNNFMNVREVINRIFPLLRAKYGFEATSSIVSFLNSQLDGKRVKGSTLVDDVFNPLQSVLSSFWNRKIPIFKTVHLSTDTFQRQQNRFPTLSFTSARQWIYCQYAFALRWMFDLNGKEWSQKSITGVAFHQAVEEAHKRILTKIISPITRIKNARFKNKSDLEEQTETETQTQTQSTQTQIPKPQQTQPHQTVIPPLPRSQPQIPVVPPKQTQAQPTQTQTQTQTQPKQTQPIPTPTPTPTPSSSTSSTTTETKPKKLTKEERKARKLEERNKKIEEDRERKRLAKEKHENRIKADKEKRAQAQTQTQTQSPSPTPIQTQAPTETQQSQPTPIQTLTSNTDTQQPQPTPIPNEIETETQTPSPIQATTATPTPTPSPTPIVESPTSIPETPIPTPTPVRYFESSRFTETKKRKEEEKKKQEEMDKLRYENARAKEEQALNAKQTQTQQPQQSQTPIQQSEMNIPFDQISEMETQDESQIHQNVEEEEEDEEGFDFGTNKLINQIAKDSVRRATIGAPKRYSSLSKSAEFEKQVKNVVRQHVKTEVERNLPVSVKIEHEFNHQMDGFQLAGRIDRLEIDQNGNATIVENKVSLRNPNWKDLFQIRLYALALVKETGKIPSVVRQSLTSTTREPIEVKQEHLDETVQILTTIANSIKRGKFYAAKNPETCSGCSFNKICPGAWTSDSDRFFFKP